MPDLPEVGCEVESEDLKETLVVDPGDDTGQPEEHANVRENDLAILFGGEHDGRRGEVCQSTLEAISVQSEVEDIRLVPLGYLFCPAALNIR